MTVLTKKSLEIHAAWKNADRPCQGPLHDERLRIRATYKSAIRAAQRAPRQSNWDQLHEALCRKDTNDFWKTWRRMYSKSQCHLPPVVNGVSAKKDIAEVFREYFEKNSTPNNPEKVKQLDEKFAILHHYYIYQYLNN